MKYVYVQYTNITLYDRSPRNLEEISMKNLKYRHQHIIIIR